MDPCASMCEVARRSTAACLEAWGTTWTQRGYEGPDDFDAWCSTWVWEQRQLTRQAGAGAALRPWCEDRAEELRWASCEELAGLGWEPTW